MMRTANTQTKNNLIKGEVVSCKMVSCSSVYHNRWMQVTELHFPSQSHVKKITGRARYAPSSLNSDSLQISVL